MKLVEALMEVWVNGRSTAGLKEKKADGVFNFFGLIYLFLLVY